VSRIALQRNLVFGNEKSDVEGATAHGECGQSSQPDQYERIQQGAQASGLQFAGPQIVTCSVDDLCPHRSYERHGLSVSAMQLAALARLEEAAFHDPLVITRERTLIDGYGRWELAKQRGRHPVICIEYDLTEAEALRWLIQAHLSSRG